MARAIKEAGEESLQEVQAGSWKIRVRGLYVRDMVFERPGALTEPSPAEIVAERLFRVEHPGLVGTTLGYVLEGWPEYARHVAAVLRSKEVDVHQVVREAPVFQ